MLAESIGGILGMAILSLLLSTFAFKSLEPAPRAVATVMTAYVIAVVVFGSQDGGRFVYAALIYAPGFIVMVFERKRHYEKHWGADDHLSDTFR